MFLICVLIYILIYILTLCVRLLLIILTNNINILVFYTSIYLQFIYKLMFIYNLFPN